MLSPELVLCPPNYSDIVSTGIEDAGRRLAMRVTTFLVLSGLIAFPTSGGAQVPAGERKVFRYGDEARVGALIHDYANRWVEIVEAEERYLFEEIGRSNDTIELIDRPRDVGLKVHADRGEIRLPGAAAWQPWEQGKWIKLDQLPKSIRFVPSDQKIRLVYFVPKDREPIAHFAEKIRVVMQVVAELYADLKGQGYPSAGLTFPTNSQGEPIVHLVRTERPAQYYSDAPARDDARHFENIRRDIPGEVASPLRHMIVLFPETYEPGPAKVEWQPSIGRGTHISPDGGLAIMSAWILRDEFCATTFAEQKKLILDATPIKGRTAFETGKVDAPRFDFIEDGFGATAHELGHALGLPHDVRDRDDIMGHGFRHLQVNYLPASAKKPRLKFSKENARLLGVSRYLMPATDRTDNTPPSAELVFRISKGRPPELKVSIKATDDRELRAAVFYDYRHDTVIGGTELTGKNQTLELALPLDTKLPDGPDLFTLLSSAKPPAGQDGAQILTLLADAGGNIVYIASPITSP
jgi:Putative peptidase family